MRASSAPLLATLTIVVGTTVVKAQTDFCGMSADGRGGCPSNTICKNLNTGVACYCPTYNTYFRSDLNPCAGDSMSICPANTACCNNSPFSFECICRPGYTGIGYLLGGISNCSDIDECQRNSSLCGGQHENCANTDGSYTCKCATGYTRKGGLCTNINECRIKPKVCSGQHERCRDTDGSYRCECGAGFERTGGVCNTIDRCADGSHMCHSNATCHNLGMGLWDCACVNGYTGPGTMCQDIDECQRNSSLCSGQHENCTNTDGSYTCKCATGYARRGGLCTADITLCESGWSYFESFCYNVAERPSRFFETLSAYCAGYQARIADITSAAENQFIYNLFVRAGVQKTFLGYIFMGSVFVWNHSHLPGPYQNWATDEPSGPGPVESCTEMYILPDRNSSDNGKWNDRRCASTSERSVVCKKDLNECTINATICGSNANCSNADGGYTCNCHPGYAHNGTLCVSRSPPPPPPTMRLTSSPTKPTATVLTVQTATSVAMMTTFPNPTTPAAPPSSQPVERSNASEETSSFKTSSVLILIGCLVLAFYVAAWVVAIYVRQRVRLASVNRRSAYMRHTGEKSADKTEMEKIDECEEQSSVVEIEDAAI